MIILPIVDITIPAIFKTISNISKLLPLLYFLIGNTSKLQEVPYVKYVWETNRYRLGTPFPDYTIIEIFFNDLSLILYFVRIIILNSFVFITIYIQNQEHMLGIMNIFHKQIRSCIICKEKTVKIRQTSKQNTNKKHRRANDSTVFHSF